MNSRLVLAWLELNNMTKAQLAAKLGVHPGTLWRQLNSAFRVKLDFLRAVSNVTGIQVCDLDDPGKAYRERKPHRVRSKVRQRQAV